MNLTSLGGIIFQLLELGQKKKQPFLYKYYVAHKHSKPNSGHHPGFLLFKALLWLGLFILAQCAEPQLCSGT